MFIPYAAERGREREVKGDFIARETRYWNGESISFLFTGGGQKGGGGGFVARPTIVPFCTKELEGYPCPIGQQKKRRRINPLKLPPPLEGRWGSQYTLGNILPRGIFPGKKGGGGERTAPEGEGEKGKKRKSFTTADMALAGGRGSGKK